MGTTLSRREMLRLALMSSENRAASSLARHYRAARRRSSTAMNFKAASLGMHAHALFAIRPDCRRENVSTASDLAKLVQAAAEYPLIREFTTTPSHSSRCGSTGRMLGFNNSNALVKNQAWDITLQKTGYIREAGKCVVMLVNIASKPFVIVLLDSLGKYTRIADAQRVKHWLETGESLAMRRSKAARAVEGARDASHGACATHADVCASAPRQDVADGADTSRSLRPALLGLAAQRRARCADAARRARARARGSSP